MKDKKLIEELLGDEYAATIIREFALENDTPEGQAQFIALLGENVIQRITFEILKILPEADVATFESFIGAGDLEGLRKFLLFISH